MRGRRVVVGSLGSLLLPSMVVLLPMGITFAAARVYAESAPPPESCEAGTVSACEDAGEGAACNACSGGSCACVSTLCNAGQETRDTRVCKPFPACDALRPVDDLCGAKAAGQACTDGTMDGRCTAARAWCVEDGGLTTSDYLACTPSGGGTSSGGNGTSSGGFVPGPDKVPGSSGQPVPENNDEGCSTSGSSGAPLLGLPLAIGLALALRRKKRS